MLKIKDNVDLKELKKFGFNLYYNCYVETGESWLEYLYKLKESCVYSFKFKRRITVKKGISHKTKIEYVLEEFDSSEVETLYDLIKAGLVEKVEDRN